ncbi:unnamed protein product [Pieris macdunnoughi]|uniref:Uncharacterized protein n=1 Tax=Pieris macdunnoughi TaxID=345717 RepID=A0A821WKV3_9NEOP|nr:unnamed protein product [Pieris macdunnoughi]
MYEIIILSLFYLFSTYLSDQTMSEPGEPEPVITSNFIDIDELINGDIPLFTDFYLPSIKDRDNNTKRRRSDEFFNSRSTLPILLAANYDQIPCQNSSFDILEFNKLNPIVNNISRRYYNNYWYGYTDPDDQEINYENEKLKNRRLYNVAIQFLLHSRYLIRKVMSQKAKFRKSTRYKIGYLFNRLRRIRYEQLKIVTVAENQLHTDNWQNLTALLRFYEKVVRMDVDLKDTILWIKDFHNRSEMIKDQEMKEYFKNKGDVVKD